MKVKSVGAFRELPHGDRNGPSIHEFIRTEPHEAEAKIIQYLESGVGWVACAGPTIDVLDESSPLITCPDVLTDGVWAWYGDITYYIEKYHVRLPDEFIEHMKINNWMVPSEDPVDVFNLEF